MFLFVRFAPYRCVSRPGAPYELERMMWPLRTVRQVLGTGPRECRVPCLRGPALFSTKRTQHQQQSNSSSGHAMYSVLPSLAHASARAAIPLTFPTSPAGARELSCTPAAAIAAEAKELSVLHDLIEVANLVKPLMNPWAEMTIFAPSNNAFDDLAGADPVAVLATNRVALEAVLTLHIVDGAFTTADLYDGQVLETAAGAELTVEVHDTHIDIVAPGDTAPSARSRSATSPPAARCCTCSTPSSCPAPTSSSPPARRPTLLRSALK